ncbi:hypothetical protein BDQ17DRAFT_1362438 [Cyathus striatus]|nr:hypothetical protein BDQ17DRAFT_1362438 [Cyathus striatus]
MSEYDPTQFIQFCLQYSTIALLYYDYFLTFPMEVKHIWQSKSRGWFLIFLYFCCRYALVANVLYLLAVTSNLNLRVCTAPLSYIEVLTLIITVVWTIRTYIVFGKNRLILWFLSFIGFACVVIDIVQVPVTRCKENWTIPIVGVLLSLFMCFFEFSSAVLMLYQCAKMYKAQDGENYAKGLLNIVVQQVTWNVFTLITLICLPIFRLLTARFWLHLRRWNSKHLCHESDSGGFRSSWSALPHDIFNALNQDLGDPAPGPHPTPQHVETQSLPRRSTHRQSFNQV